MDFFAHQDAARRQTGWLVVYFILGVIGIVAAVYITAVMVLGFMGYEQPPGGRDELLFPFWKPEILLGVTTVTAAIVGAGSLYKTLQLSQGGETIALMLGGRPLNTDTRDQAERRVLNVVEEMALASGVPVPPVYLLENEEGINAFAAGHRPSNAVIGVTRGTIDRLKRDELQGVMAHEFSHILNGDMRLNLRLTGLIHGILILSVIGFYLLRSTSGSRKGGAGLAFFGVALLIIGYVGSFFGQLIRASISRQREFLADASAVQFTRDPDGIAGALKKISAYAHGSRVQDSHAPEVSHMFFSLAMPQLFATHPPLEERIRRIEPHWDGSLPKIREQPVEEDVPKKKRQRTRLPFPVTADGVMGRVGLPGAEQIAAASAIIDGLPQEITAATHETYGAQAVVYGVLLHTDPQVRRRQLATLQRDVDPPVFDEVIRLAPSLEQLPPEDRLPTVELVIPAIKSMSRSQYLKLRDNVFNLVSADKKVSLFEYVLQLLVIRCLDEYFHLRAAPKVIIHELSELKADLVTVLSLLAYAGSKDDARAERAFDAGLQVFGSSQKQRIIPRREVLLASFGPALDRLDAAEPRLKRQTLSACVSCITADQQVTIQEFELVRAIAAVLDCPVPLLAVSQESSV